MLYDVVDSSQRGVEALEEGIDAYDTPPRARQWLSSAFSTGAKLFAAWLTVDGPREVLSVCTSTCVNFYWMAWNCILWQLQEIWKSLPSSWPCALDRGCVSGEEMRFASDVMHDYCKGHSPGHKCRRTS
uniref:Uncharacterized protein n=1 Tax=Trypanosoma congolense (strain IL3000) TaxID=1068625 RepID=F9WJY1_TRYCI|nr:hypothetical protein, unlikely [Trypanosoma congolense IL3000]